MIADEDPNLARLDFGVKETDFLSLQIPASYQRDRKWNIIWGEFDQSQSVK